MFRAMLRSLVLVVTAVSLNVVSSSESCAQQTKPLAFEPAAHNTFVFDTGHLTGQLRTGQLAYGVDALEQVPPGHQIAGRYGVMNIYRVFSDGKRYGEAGWGWPSRAERRRDGSVVITSQADKSRPFTFSAHYRWISPTTLDLRIEVVPRRELHKFEVFLASYFDASYDRCQVNVRAPSGGAEETTFKTADRSLGNWLMFPRDQAAIKLIQDGRWQLPPHPVEWAILDEHARPLVVRRKKSGTAVLLMARPQDCFAVAMPYETEAHYSVYFSLFGRDLAAGQPAVAHASMTVVDATSAQDAVKCFEAFIDRCDHAGVKRKRVESHKSGGAK